MRRPNRDRRLGTDEGVSPDEEGRLPQKTALDSNLDGLDPRHGSLPDLMVSDDSDEILEPESIAWQLRRRRDAANRMAPLPDGRRDPIDRTPRDGAA